VPRYRRTAINFDYISLSGGAITTLYSGGGIGSASDLFDAFIGGTVQRIAHAFRAAEDDDDQ